MKYECRTCGKTGEENFYENARYQCKQCWNKRTSQSQKDKVKSIKEHYGGKCVRCGYNKCQDALEFHHQDPTQKEFHLGEKRGLSIEKLIPELNKCLLVCRNCHTEIHFEMKYTS